MTAPHDVRVSVVLAVHDPGKELGRTLDRLASTLGPDDELVLVDDGSRDGTPGRVAAWRQGHPGLAGRLTLLTLPENRGVAAARNVGLARASGALVWFVDWDDTWSTDILDRLCEAHTRTGASVVVCGAELVDERGVLVRRLGPRLRGPVVLDGPGVVGLALLEGRIHGYLWNKLYPRSVLGEDPFPTMRSQSDFAGSAPVLARQERVALLPDVLYAHVRREGSLTNTAYPSADSFAVSLRVAEQIAGDLITSTAEAAHVDRVRRALLSFRYRELHLTVANNALRLSRATPYRRRMLATAVRGTSWSEVATLLPRTPVLAARAAVLLATRQHYPLVYDAYARVRRLAVRWRRPRHRVDQGELTW